MSVSAFVVEEIRRILSDKGAPIPDLNDQTIFLGDDMDFDSLDLAGLVVALEQKTGRDPFRKGFVEFRTIGELTQLYETLE